MILFPWVSDYRPLDECFTYSAEWFRGQHTGGAGDAGIV